jgi:hypothetical protein
VEARFLCEMQFCRSGKSGLTDAEQFVGLGVRRGEPVIVSPHASELELQGLNPGTQSGDLVEQAPIGRRTYVAVEGLRHDFSL